MALTYGGGPVPSTGIGNIGHIFGPSNSPGSAGPAPVTGMAPQVRPMMGGPQRPELQGGAGQFGNINVGPPARPMPPQAQGGFQQIMQQLHPGTMNALRSIPPEALQQLHAAGLIHPGLMQHLHGGGVSNSGGRQY